MRKYIRSVDKLYAKSPFKLVYEHAVKGNETVHKLEELVRAFCDGDMKRVNEIADEISNLEHEADKIKQSIRNRLPSSVLLCCMAKLWSLPWLRCRSQSRGSA